MPAYIRPLFCEGQGPFRWVALSGDPADIFAHRRALMDAFPDNERLVRWMRMAQERVQFQGLPARICWLGYGERAMAGPALQRPRRRAASVKAPIVIGRDHLDAGSVASPNRETEAMRDGSDAIADWPILNALLNTAAGATLGQSSTTAAAWASATRSTRAWSSSPTARPRRRAGSSACSPPIPAWASCATPTRATPRRSTRRRHGLNLPGVTRP